MLIFIIYAILLRSDHAYIESADTTASFIKFSPASVPIKFAPGIYNLSCIL